VQKTNCLNNLENNLKNLLRKLILLKSNKHLIYKLLKQYIQPEESLELEPADEIESDEDLCGWYETGQ
jgi:hypothetical protein